MSNSNSNENIDGRITVNDNVKPDQNPTMIYSFPEQGKGKWRVQDDAVMGGRSDSQLKITQNKHAYFSGSISLENNGGFCSIHQTVEKDPYLIPKGSKMFVIRLNGDGKKYNFRVRTRNGRYSYGFTFLTKSDGNYESISIPFNQMEATYHGEPVEVPNYAGEDVLEMQLLIGNDKEESFEIFIETVEVE